MIQRKGALGVALMVLAVICPWGMSTALGNDRVKQAGRQLAEALDSDPNISPQVKAALKQYIAAVDEAPGALEPTEDMKLQFAGRLDAWFNEKEQEANGGNVIARYDKKGFGLRTTDDQFSLNVNGRVHVNFLNLNHDSDDESRSDGFRLRRARLAVSGNLQEHVGFKLDGDFAGSAAKLKDGYIDLKHFGSAATFRAGQFKEPFGYEELRSSRYDDFVEQSLATDNLAPSRDVGAMVKGKLADGVINYAIGIFNGNGSNKTDENSDSDVAGRLQFKPFKNGDNECIEGLQLGVNLTHGRQKATDSAKEFETAAGTSFLTLGDMSGGFRVRYGADAQWFWGPASIQTEWIKSEWKDVKFGADTNESSLTINSYYFGGTYLLTGEKKVEGRLHPEHNFDPASDGWGAWELVARYGGLRAQGDVFKTAEAVSGGTDEAHAITAGFNWYLNPFTIVRVNYVNTQFNDAILIRSGMSKTESAVIGRLQVEF